MVYFIVEFTIVTGLYWIFTGKDINEYPYFDNNGLFGKYLGLFDWIQNKI